MTCTCGVCYDLDCPTEQHRHLARLERVEHPGIELVLRPALYVTAGKLGKRVIGWRFLPAAA